MKFPTVFKAFSTEIKSAQNRFVSSTNWLSLISFPNSLIPVILDSCLSLFDNNSVESTNKYGEGGHRALYVCTKRADHHLILVPKLNASSAFLMKGHSSESKAFRKSNDTKIKNQASFATSYTPLCQSLI